jgi:Secretion system C-terminal sorting domain/Bacterial Ig-like domain (group 2)
MTKRFTSLALCLVLFATLRLSAQAIFTDAYATGVTFAAFGDSKNDVTIDNTVNQSGTSSLKIVVPATGYTGGAFVAATPQNLLTYNAVSFWIKGSAAKTLNVCGLGNNAVSTVYAAELEKVAVTTTWTKVIVPIPLSTKVTAETGLFHFAEGSDEGAYTIWLDNIQYENLATTVIGVPTASIATETIAKIIGDAFSASGLTTTIPVNGTAVKLSTAKAYFTFTSSAPAVATVSALGEGKAVAAGTAAITAKLGAISATGTLTVNVSGLTTPTAAAPTPTRAAANVISLFSNAYTNKTVDTWSASWDQADVADVQIAGNDTKKYTGLTFAGIEFTAAATQINAKDMTHFHIDIWTPNSTLFKVKLVDFGANGIYQGTPNDDSEHELSYTPALGSWVGYDIPMINFTDLKAREHLAQMILSGSNATVFIDNVYFYKDVVSNIPTVAAPTPTRPATSVISLFSNAYTNKTVDTWSASWDQADVADVQIAGNDTKRYTNLTFAGVEFTATANLINAKDMNYFHVDIWTPDATTFKVKLVDFGANKIFQGTPNDDTEFEATYAAPARGSWVSYDIPLTSLPTRENVAQLILSATNSTVYMDNLYFFKTGVGTNDVTFAKNLFSVTPSVSDASVTLNLTENVKGSTQIMLSNVSGQAVYNQALTTNGTALTHAISTKNLPNGIYVVNVRVGTTVQTEKIVVAH